MMMNHSSGADSADVKHSYPLSSNPATLSLNSLLVEEISALGPLSFDRWMQHCLYHPEFGYYTKGAQNVGKYGDFFTSVSVGSCFGSILAERIAKYNQHTGANEILEIGANTGQLACDILDHLHSHYPDIYSEIRYNLCEPLHVMQEVQLKTLSLHQPKISHCNSLADFKSTSSNGIILSNELFDAFPVKLIIRKEQQWLERCVDYKESQFQWLDQAITSPKLAEFVDELGDYPEDYQTEYRPGLASFVELSARCFEHALSITIDYGYPKSTFYDISRKSGTLRCFTNHHADESPLETPGQKDISAHVDFTQLAQDFTAAHFSPQYFDSQTRYLIQHATPLLKKIEEGKIQEAAKWIRQFQTLTHPSMMGQQFNVLECELNQPANQQALRQLEIL
ncbi:class I SAM-dependent methyltransferase [Rubritalea spongiae]|uniref:Class I SAM-dependent methyltransferase n=1 Tax=Rubritalea spongiae TaxID=430797 RepID=A0ABW5E5H0_9BACT